MENLWFAGRNALFFTPDLTMLCIC